MKKNYNIWFSLIPASVLVLLLNGCGGYIHKTIYLGDVDVTGPTAPPPTHLEIGKEPGNIAISPKFLYSVEDRFVGATEDSYNKAIPISDSLYYTPKNNNLTWNIPSATIGADIDITASELFSFFVGLHVLLADHKSLPGGNFGVGIHNYGKEASVRFDIGLSFQKYSYEAVTIVHTVEDFYSSERREYITAFEDKGEDTNLNPFFTLTINSTDEDGLINYYGSVGYFTHSLLGFDPEETHYITLFGTSVTETDDRSSCMVGFVYIASGLSFKLENQIRLMVSANILKEVASVTNSGVIINPSLQLDFLF